MYEEETQKNILERMLSRVSDKFDKRASSVIYDTHSSTAIELQNLYVELEYIIKNSYGTTAAREFLILLAKDRGLEPNPATNAILKGVFTPNTIDVTGKRFNIGDINYTVLEQIIPGQYQVKCETAGIIGNQYFSNMVPMDYIAGLQTAQLTDILIPGEAEEDTEVFRQRYFDSFHEQSFGGNRADYLAKVKNIDGVGDCKLVRVWNGDIRPTNMIPSDKVKAWYEGIINTLDTEVASWLSAVYTASCEKKLTVGGTVLAIVINSFDFGEASAVLLNKIQAELDPVEYAGEGYGLAPIGHVVNVKSAEPVKIYIKSAVTFEEGYSWSNTKMAIQEAVDAYLLELRKGWADSSNIIVRVSRIENSILNVKGVLDVANTKINESISNITLAKYEIPIFGGVSE